MNYCNDCGATLIRRIPEGEHLWRDVCSACHKVHYENPKIVAGCIPECKGKILLCRRAIEPRLGFWTFPAGFMELGEGAEEAACRETLEEAKAHVTIESLFALYSLPHVGQVYIVYRGTLHNQDFGPGDESLEVKLLSPEAIPWKDLAFPVIHETLKHYMEDLGQKTWKLHGGSINRQTSQGHHDFSFSPITSSPPESKEKPSSGLKPEEKFP